MRFVIADDQHTPRSILERILTELGHKVVGAADTGTLALELTLATHPDAVIFDISMPRGISGDQAAYRVHEALPDVQIFMVSNISNDHVRRELERRAGAEFVVKPFRREQLETKIVQTMQARLQ